MPATAGVRSTITDHGRRGAGRRAAAPRRLRRPLAQSRRPPAGFFLARGAQQVTSILAGPLPVGDLVAAGAMLGTLALWGLALHLLAV